MHFINLPISKSHLPISPNLPKAPEKNATTASIAPTMAAISSLLGIPITTAITNRTATINLTMNRAMTVRVCVRGRISGKGAEIGTIKSLSKLISQKFLFVFSERAGKCNCSLVYQFMWFLLLGL